MTFKQYIEHFFKGETLTDLSNIINWRFAFFLFVLTIIYITNTNSIERDLRRINDLSAEIKDLEYEDITTSSKLMDISKQSNVLQRVNQADLGLQELTEPPRILNVE